MKFDELLAQARPVEHTVPICLRGDLVAEFEQLERRLDAALKTPDNSSLAGSPAQRIAEQIEQLRAQMQPTTRTFRLRALPRATYQALTAAHPPRRDAEGAVLEDDRGFDVDTSTFWTALVRACLVDPQPTAEQWDRLDEVLSDAQFELLAIAAHRANRGEVDVPFSHAASVIIRNSGGESNAPSGSESLSGVSTDGSLAAPSSATRTDD